MRIIEVHTVHLYQYRGTYGALVDILDDNELTTTASLVGGIPGSDNHTAGGLSVKSVDSSSEYWITSFT
jgi:hypothetical protein